MGLLVDAVWLLAIFFGLTLYASSEVRHPYTKCLLSMFYGVLFIIPTLFDVRFAVLPALVAIVLCFISERKTAILFTVFTCLCVLVITLYPDADNQLYLQARYPDTFTRVSDGVYYASTLGTTITMDRHLGDTYQSRLYEDWILRTATRGVPMDAVVDNLWVEPVQTKALFTSVQEYLDTVAPTVHMRIKLPERSEWTPDQLPYNSVVEMIP